VAGYRATEAEAVLAARSEELTDRLSEVRALQADLALKEAWAAHLQGELDRAQAEIERLLSVQARAVELEAELRATRARASYRLVDRVGRWLDAIPGAPRVRRWASHRTARG